MMDQRTNKILFALLRSAICGTKLTDAERAEFSAEQLQELLKISAKHDMIHLLVFGLKQNDLLPPEQAGLEKYIFKAAYRYERLRVEYEKLCHALEEAEIPFLRYSFMCPAEPCRRPLRNPPVQVGALSRRLCFQRLGLT